MGSGRILAVDPGTTRIGLAVSDESQKVALPLETLVATGSYLEELAAIAHDYQISRVVVGLPKRLDGTEGPSAISARTFAAEIGGHLGIKVEMYDERLTTKAAERSLSGVPGRKRRRLIDAAAAAILLQSYLDERNQSRVPGESGE